MNLLTWNDYLATGVDIIDQQHRGLMDLVNETSAKLNSSAGLSPEEIQSLLSYLLDYAAVHFSTEEALMALGGLDSRHTERHHETHARFVQQVSDMIAGLKHGSTLSGEQLVAFLGNWLIYHILGEDRAMARQLRAHAGVPAAAEEALTEPADPAQAAATKSLANLYAILAQQNQQLLATERERRSSQEQLTETIAERSDELNASEQRFRALFSSGALPIIVAPLGPDHLPGPLSDANPAACELLGYSREELLGLSPQDLVAAEERARFPLLMSELLTTGRFDCEMVHVTKAGRRFVARMNITHYVEHGKVIAMAMLQEAPAANSEKQANADLLAEVRSGFLANMDQEVRLPRHSLLSLVRSNTGDPERSKAEILDIPLFQDLTAEQKNLIENLCSEKRLLKDELLFLKGDKPGGLFVVGSGQIKLALPSPQGTEKVLGIFGPGQSFGEAEVLAGQPYPFLAQALSDSRVLQLGQAELLDLLAANPAFAQRLLVHMGKRIHQLVLDVESYTLRSGMERVIGYLLQHTRPRDDGQFAVELPASKGVIASLLHVTPETLSRIFHELKQSGQIQMKGRRIQIPDIAQLVANRSGNVPPRNSRINRKAS
ncbi:MAG TPA: bacteriohemerythrin [Rhodocyclaceae bacterium]